MSIASELTNLQADITAARTAIVNKGGTVTEGGGSSQLAVDIGTISGGPTPTGSISIASNGTYDVTNYATAIVNVLPVDYLTLSSDSTMTVIPASDWNATTRQYSVNGGVSWTDWTDEAEITGTNIKFRGLGGTIASGVNMIPWSITGTDVSLSGNIETVLDYQVVASGGHPNMEAYAYYAMFAGGEDPSPLTSIDGLILPATTLTANCYNYLFAQTSLVDVSKLSLPATNLAPYCYANMFAACYSLIYAVTALPATELAPFSYQMMFYDCEMLMTAPVIAATTLAASSCSEMFEYCATLGISDTSGNAFFTCPTTIPDGAVSSMFGETKGPYTDDPVIGQTYYYEPLNYLTFREATGEDVVVTPSASWDATMKEYSTDYGADWETYTSGTVSGSVVMFRGEGGTVGSAASAPWTVTGSSGIEVKVSGNIETILDYTTLASGTEPTMGTRAFEAMFKNCTVLTDASELRLPATTLTDYCYSEMFSGCANLTRLPALPAYYLTKYCYQDFAANTAIIEIPYLLDVESVDEGSFKGAFRGTPITSFYGLFNYSGMAPYAYASMFENCTNLTSCEGFTIHSVAGKAHCCEAMFKGCTSLVDIPSTMTISQSTWSGSADYAYASMFENCTNLTHPPVFTLGPCDNYFCQQMFYGCTAMSVTQRTSEGSTGTLFLHTPSAWLNADGSTVYYPFNNMFSTMNPQKSRYCYYFTE